AVAGLANAAPPKSNHVSGRLLAQPVASTDANLVTAAYARAGGRLHHTVSGINVHVIDVPEQAADQIAGTLMKTGLFTFVEPDFVASSGSTTVTPNDPDFSSQWHLAAIKASSAWGITTGASSAPIAIIDSGVDSTHPDLSSKVVAGWNFLNGTSNT